MSVQRQAQAFYLSSGPTTTGSIVQLKATSALPLLMDDLIINGDSKHYATSTISRITVSGQSILASSEDMCMAGFFFDALIEGQRSISATIDTNQQFMVECQLQAAATVANPINMAISTTPTDVVVSPNNLPSSLLNYCFGMGRGAIGIGATVVFTATSLRDNVFLGRLVGDFKHDAGFESNDPNALEITSILCDGIELLSAQNPANAGLSYQNILPGSSNKDGLQANYVLSQNSRVSISVKNNSTHAADVAMGFFCRPL